MIKARTRRVIQGSDYSGQEPRCLSALCKDEGMLNAYRTGRDLYVEIASIALHLPYNECLEHFPKDTPIKKSGDDWYYATEEEIAENKYDKLADGTTDTYHIGKERRGQAKKILLGIMYGRGEKSIAEQLDCSVEEARDIKNSVYKAFPNIKLFEEESNELVRTKGFVTTLWGRKRRLPDYNLPPYEYKYIDDENNILSMAVPESIQNNYTKRLLESDYREKDTIIKNAKKHDNILIIDNNSKIATAQRQIINSRVQGSSADMSKLALIKIYNDEELRNRGVKLIIPVHDEILIETPLRYAKYVKDRFAKDMCDAPQPKLGIDMSCDVVTAYGWYHEELDLDKELQGLED